MDADYLAKLSPEERAWYADFCDSHYNGSRTSVSADWTQAEFREAFTRNRASRRDIYTYDLPARLPEDIEQEESEAELAHIAKTEKFIIKSIKNGVTPR
jgi:hypothetical protein